MRSALVADSLQPGDVLKTEADSRLVAQFNDGSEIDLAAQTELRLAESATGAQRPSKVKLTVGDIMVLIQPGGGDFDVETPVAIAAVQGTKFLLDADAQKAVLTVFNGEVEFRNEQGRVTAREMERSIAFAGRKPTDPRRVVGARWGEDYWGHVFAGKWHLQDGEHLHVDATPYTRADAEQAMERLAASPETPELLAELLGALWSKHGGVHLSLECARELADMGARLTALRRSELGVVLPLSEKLAAPGIPIFHVTDGTPAHRAGLRPDDVILSVNGASIDTETDLIDQLCRVQPGISVEILIARGDQKQTVAVTPDAAKPTPQELALIAALRLLKLQPGHAGARMVVANARACLGDWDEAARAYTTLLAEDPENAAAINNLGVMAVLEDRLADALGHFDRAARLAPDFEGAWFNTARVYVIAGMAARHRALLQSLDQQHPEWESTSARLAYYYHLRREAVDRIDDLERLAQAHPQNASIAGSLAAALARSDRRTEARRACERALELGLDNPPARLTLVWHFLSREEAPAVTAEMLEAWAPRRFPFIYIYAAGCYDRHGMPEDAIAALERGAELDPANSSGLAGYLVKFLGDRYRKAHRQDEALDCFLRAADLEPNWAEPWLSAYQVAGATGHSEDAGVYIKKGRLADPTWGSHYLYEFHMDRKQLAEAETVAREGLKASPPGHTLHALQQADLARALAAQEKWDDAVTHASLSLLALGDADDENGPVRYALEALQRVLEHSPNPQRLAEMREGVLGCLETAETLAPSTQDRLLDHLDRQGAVGDLEERVQHSLRILETQGDGPALRRARATAARSLASLAPERARQHFRDVTAQDPADDLPWLGLYWATKGTDPQEAVQAGLQAIARATSRADDWGLYHDLGDFLAEMAPEAGTRAFRERLEQLLETHDMSPLARAQFAVAAEGCGLLQEMVDALLASEDAAQLTEMAEHLSGLERHQAAMDLMERAVRLDGRGPWRAYRVFSAAGDLARVISIYEEKADQPHEDGQVLWPGQAAQTAAEFWANERNLAKFREWLERARADGSSVGFHRGGGTWQDYHLCQWAKLHIFEGNVSAAISAAEEAVALNCSAGGVELAQSRLDWISQLADAKSPVATLCDWVREDVGPEPAGKALEAAHSAAKAGQAMWAVAEALATVPAEQADLAAGWARRLIEDYPDSVAAWIALAETTRDTDPTGAQAAAQKALELLEASAGVSGLPDGDQLRLALAAGRQDLADQAMAALLNSDDAGRLAELAEHLSGHGHHDQAMDLMERAVRLGWNVFSARRAFPAAGDVARLISLCEERAVQPPEDGYTNGPGRSALVAAEMWGIEGDWAKCREWLERARADGSSAGFSSRRGGNWRHYYLCQWAYLHLGEGNVSAAISAAEEAVGPNPEATGRAQKLLDRVGQLADAKGPVATLCDWIREDVGPEPAGQALQAALSAAEAGQAMCAVAEALATVPAEQADLAAGWARRLIEDYPDSPAAWIALAETTRDTDPTGAQAAGQKALELQEASGSLGGLPDGDQLQLMLAIGRRDLLDQAMEELLNSDDPGHLAKVAEHLSGLQHHDQAMDLMERAVRLGWSGGWRPHGLFSAAGDAARLISIYEELADQPPEDGQAFGPGLYAQMAAECWALESNWAKCREWLERARADGSSAEFSSGGWIWESYHLSLWAQLHTWEGNVSAAISAAEEAVALNRNPEPPDRGQRERAQRELDRIGRLAEAQSLVATLCDWIREEVGPEPAGQALHAALSAAQGGRPKRAVAEALATVPAEQADLAARWARRLTEDYPDSRAAWLALAETTRDTDPTGAQAAEQKALELLEAAGGASGLPGGDELRLALAAGRRDLADQAVEELLNSDDASGLAALAAHLSGLQHHDQAMDLMERAVRLGGGRPWGAYALFSAAGDAARLISIYEELADQPGQVYGPGWAAEIAAELWATESNWAKCRKWLERARADGSNAGFFSGGWMGNWRDRHLYWWAKLHLGEGNLSAAISAAEEAVALNGKLAEPAQRQLDRIGQLADASSPVATLCDWIREEVGPEPAGQALLAALSAAEAGQPERAVAEALAAVPAEQADLAVRWARRLTEDYPDSRADQAMEELLNSDNASRAAELAEQAEQLSRLQHHDQAMDLMERAVRLGGCSPYRARSVFAAAGDTVRLISVYEELADQPHGDGQVRRPGQAAQTAAELWRSEGNRAKCREWLERARADGSSAGFSTPRGEIWQDWHLIMWALLHQWEGNVSAAISAAEEAIALNCNPAAAERAQREIDQIGQLADARDPVATLCDWIREEVGPEPAGQALQAALSAAKRGQPKRAVAEALAVIGDQRSHSMVEWAEELSELYPDNAAVWLALQELTGQGETGTRELPNNDGRENAGEE